MSVSTRSAPACAVDHIVVAACSLDEGSRYIEALLGVETTAGGKHPAMGTHNRLVRLGSAAYIEVIAIDPAAARPARPRWFALDDPRVQRHLACGPRLVHWVARSDDIAAAAHALPECGMVQPMQRGSFTWQLTVRGDGALPFGGVIPSFIAWRGAHPADSLPERGLHLERLAGTHPRWGDIHARLELANCGGLITLSGGEPALQATIATASGFAELG